MTALLASAIEREVVGTPFAGRVLVTRLVDSTVDVCRDLADGGAPEGVVVVAEGQRRGRGQRGHGWFSPPGGGLYLSALLRPTLLPEQAPLLTLAAGWAACSWLRDEAGVDAVIKEPNDLLAAAPGGGAWRKLGGLLVDTAVQGGALRHAVVSLGLNVDLAAEDFPPELRDAATSLRLLTGDAWTREAAAGGFLRQLAAVRAEMDGAVGPWTEDLRRRHADLVVQAPDFRLPELRG